MRSWPALEVRFPPSTSGELADLLAAALDDFHPTAIHEEDHAWRVFFASTRVRDQAARALAVAFPAGDLRLRPEDVPDEDWARRSQASLGPICVGRFTIVPPWAPLSREAAEDPHTIVIVPSMGFGTGHHASTRLCLALLQELDLAGRTVLDVGTGSGLLAIAASRLGASQVTAIDHDEDALDAARDNLGLNRAGASVELRLADLRQVDLAADLVLANLTAALLVTAAAPLAARVRPGGALVVSGFTTDQEDEVRRAYVEMSELSSRRVEDGWVGLRFTRWTDHRPARQPRRVREGSA
jgi:ribosomal protein L11 methyltransferase